MRYARVAQITLALSTAALLGACTTMQSAGSSVGNAASSTGQFIADSATNTGHFIVDTTGDTGRAVADTVTGAPQFVIAGGAAFGHEIADQFHRPTQPPNDPLRYDGSYKGAATLVQGGPTCPSSRRGVLMIGDNTLTYAYTPNQIFQVPVGADGSLHGVAGDTTLDGQIVKDRLVMTVKSPDCVTEYKTSFTLNHS